MGKTLVNRTHLLVQDDIEYILAEQPKPVQERFRSCNLIPDLLAYVLSRIPNLYAVCEENEPLGFSPITHESAQRKLQREALIYQGIYCVLEKSHSPQISEPAQNQIAQSPHRVYGKKLL
ncbi:hypothetical protein VB712_15710 [Spirulina sp. CCNP1310]|uniref:hypothetical protein n=1 Tax=Spirulina sp. CCNP1310 TaxID=3110249 RepID=UPI002B1ECEF4|nr:hypothetical protein [Spirulina sp. CCNP1310]MEA5420680.1 hypothetical protein [Spirulina sp. CCNP1310]